MTSVAPPAAELTIWSIELDRQTVAGQFAARIKVEIQKGHHLYSISQPAGGPLPTRVTVGAGIRVMRVRSWPEPIREFDPKFGMETEYHVGSVIFDVDAKVETAVAADEHEAVFTIEYQLCDEQTCLRPESKELRASIYVDVAEPAKVAADHISPDRGI